MSSILLIEDSPLFGKLAQASLEETFSRKVTWTKNVYDTKKILETKRTTFSLALVDYNLPDGPNGEAIDLVSNCGIPAIVFTADMSDTVREHVWSKNVADYVLKEDPNCFDYITQSIQRLEGNVKHKVLVVDDSTLYRKIFCDLLYVQQYQVIAAKDGAECLEILRQHPDILLILTDYNMPEMNGFALCQQIRKKHKKDELAIIGISSHNDRNMAAKFIKSGANDFLFKDRFLVEEFICRINNCIDSILLIKRSKHAAITDFLTGLYNRRYFFDAGEKLFSCSQREQLSLICAMIDIDFFKNVNDSYGHDVGDLVIKTISSIILRNVRSTDIVARFGGEEFCILAINMDSNQTCRIMNDLRKQISKTAIPFNDRQQQLQVTVSIGVCTSTEKSLEEATKRADELLYKAKNNGRNRVEITPES